jgi:uncharacterized protein YjlB
MLRYDFNLVEISLHFTDYVGIFQGSSTLLLGCGSSDATGGLKVDIYAGDVVVLPAGTAHCCLESTTDYRYIGVYPEVQSSWWLPSS